MARRTLANLKNESRKAVVFSQAQGRKEDYLLDVERVTHDNKADVWYPIAKVRVLLRSVPSERWLESFAASP